VDSGRDERAARDARDSSFIQNAFLLHTVFVLVMDERHRLAGD
jgi:hypothetical protein